ncbi:hypothetical protein [Kocuria sp. NPDC057446]
MTEADPSGDVAGNGADRVSGNDDDAPPPEPRSPREPGLTRAAPARPS